MMNFAPLTDSIADSLVAPDTSTAASSASWTAVGDGTNDGAASEFQDVLENWLAGSLEEETVANLAGAWAPPADESDGEATKASSSAQGNEGFTPPIDERSV